MYTIGEFSRMTQLTVKALRFYHEQGILIPEQISYENSYRLYGEESYEKSMRITQLKSAGFSLNEIKSIFEECHEEEDILRFLKAKQEDTQRKIKTYQEMEYRLEAWEKSLRNETMKENFDIKEMERKEMLIAAVKIKGKYSQIGTGFSLLYKKAGRWVAGKAFALYHDMEYKEKDADFEAGFKVKKKIEDDEINCRLLEKQKVVSLLHKGPYGSQGNSYARLFTYCKEKGLTPQAPLMEIYHKGPGMLFKGNPDKYLTELQIPVS